MPTSPPASSHVRSLQLFGLRATPVLPLSQVPRPSAAQSASPLQGWPWSDEQAPQTHIEDPSGASQASLNGNDTWPSVRSTVAFRPEPVIPDANVGWHWYEVAPKSG